MFDENLRPQVASAPRLFQHEKVWSRRTQIAGTTASGLSRGACGSPHAHWLVAKRDWDQITMAEPHFISALVKKRAELGGEIEML